MSFMEDVKDKPERILRCERCGKPGSDIQGEAILCDTCISLVIREWKIKHEEFGELAR